MSATGSMARYKYANHGKLKLTILADEPNRSEKKARQVPASANESLFTLLLHLLEVDWGHPQ